MDVLLTTGETIHGDGLRFPGYVHIKEALHGREMWIPMEVIITVNENGNGH